MRTHLLAGVLASSVLVAAALGSGGAPPPGSNLKLAVLPCANIELTFRKFHPLLAYLKSTTSHTVTLVVPVDLPQLETDAAYGRIDFALQDPHTFRQVSHLFDAGALLQMRSLDGTTNQRGVLVVRRDSGLTDLPQLLGRTVMFGPRTSSPKWVAARLLFESRGVVVDSDLKVTNGGCCEDIAFAVSVKSVDAGVVCDHFLGEHSARQKELGVASDSLAVIGRTPPVPTRVFAARKGVAADVVTAVTRALLDIDPANPAHARMLQSAEFRGFVRTTEAEYLKGLGGPGPQSRP
jgi:ABC-type phosphate/phosphonate transport system substrate-binding protein